MGTTPAREGHGVGRGVGRCGGAGWGARRAAARERGGHRGRRGLGHPLHVRNRRMCRPRRGARRLRRRKRRHQRAGGCSARARQLHGERGRARGVGAYVGSTSRTMARATTRKSGRRVGCSTALPPRALRCTAAHARRRHDRPASATIRIHHRRRRPLVMVAAAAAERRRRRRRPQPRLLLRPPRSQKPRRPLRRHAAATLTARWFAAHAPHAAQRCCFFLRGKFSTFIISFSAGSPSSRTCRSSSSYRHSSSSSSSCCVFSGRGRRRSAVLKEAPHHAAHHHTTQMYERKVYLAAHVSCFRGRPLSCRSGWWCMGGGSQRRRTTGESNKQRCVVGGHEIRKRCSARVRQAASFCCGNAAIWSSTFKRRL